MPSSQSTSDLIVKVKDKDPAAIQKLWEIYFQRLVKLARNKLYGSARRVGDLYPHSMPWRQEPHPNSDA